MIAPNRPQQTFTVDHPDRAWVPDITYIRTWQGCPYLAVIMGVFARKVVGWSIKPTPAKELLLDALLMAVWRRKPRWPVTVHSDQGSQYRSDWLRSCRDHNLKPSMSHRGNCWANAVPSRSTISLKKERVKKRIYKTRDLARADIFDYIEVFYKRQRRHSHISGVSPEALN
jgi:putative transposase